jgi:hypothetical protein
MAGPSLFRAVSNVTRGYSSSLRTDGSSTSRSGLAYDGGVRSTALNQAEHRGGRADPEGEHEHDERGKAWRSPYHPQAVAKVPPRAIDKRQTPVASH